MSAKHTIRSKDGGTISVNLTPMQAIKANCKECMGWETRPADCTSPLCPLYPFRTGDAHSGKTMTAANRRKLVARMKKTSRTS